ncbi:hypothetical protein MYAM1_000196 [Malassezia yamatoensis]|uniref:Uncharacterized protein n=1 Tax=Malassezia yamatoensis TaxID=253288 RepID=A0AAJ6CEP9_9BASI|nr:hypothetical protein MYAM1_000196 [Malassezia yamatoensis]
MHPNTWSAPAPMNMVYCAPSAPRLNAAQPHHDPHQPWAHAWYPLYMPMMPAQGQYSGLSQGGQPYTYGAQQAPCWAPPMGHDAHAHAYAMQSAQAQAYTAAQSTQACAYAAPSAQPWNMMDPSLASNIAQAPSYPGVPSYEALQPVSDYVAPQLAGGPSSPPRETNAIPLAPFCAETIWRASAALVGLKCNSAGDDESSPTQASLAAPTSPMSTTRSESVSPSLDRSCDSLSSCSSTPASRTCTPPTPPSARSSPESGKGSLSASMDALQIEQDKASSSTELSDQKQDEGHEHARSKALNRLVQDMQQNAQTFPSLVIHPPMEGERTPNGTRRSRISPKHMAFSGEASPAFRHFVHQVLAQTLLSPAALMLALYYVQLFPAAIGNDADISAGILSQPTSTMPFKLLALGLMMANKFLDDNTFLNKTWHEVTGIPLSELNQLESLFLRRTQFNLSVNESAWRQHLTRLKDSQTSSSKNRTENPLVLEALSALLATSFPGRDLK